MCVCSLLQANTPQRHSFTAIYASSYYYICVLMLVYVRVKKSSKKNRLLEAYSPERPTIIPDRASENYPRLMQPRERRRHFALFLFFEGKRSCDTHLSLNARSPHTEWAGRPPLAGLAGWGWGKVFELRVHVLNQL